ncbi:MAG: small, acid-soluble spore protein, alpha/beta type [Peptococcaceae bacterium]|nr:small, acid-soluble spore protein, alpha/beta type [Peptococcaceae bacterium]
MSNVKQPKKEKSLTQLDKFKLEVAEEIGLLERIRTVGWAGLSAREAGYLGGMLSKRLREQGLRAQDLK